MVAYCEDGEKCRQASPETANMHRRTLRDLTNEDLINLLTEVETLKDRAETLLMERKRKGYLDKKISEPYPMEPAIIQAGKLDMQLQK